MRYLIALLFLYSSGCFALAIDQKLAIVILDTSRTKKTILINRGSEDHLAKDDFAKISDKSKGLFAKAVLIKLAPHRSVWSVYKIYHEKLIFRGKKATLKIIKPIPLTSDKSRALKPHERYNEVQSTKADFMQDIVAPAGDNLLKPEYKELSTYFMHLEKEHTNGKDPDEDWEQIDHLNEIPPTRYDNVDFSKLDKFL